MREEGMTEFTQIEVEDRDTARIVRFARPEALNALTDTMVLETRRAMEAVEIDRSVAAVILTGDERAFCAGGDLNESASDPRPPFDKYLHRINQSVWQGFARYLAHYPKPAIAAVEGHCLGGGLEPLLALQQSIERELEALGFARERRAFTPHLTLGRVRDRISTAQSRALSDALGGVSVEPGVALPVREVSLIKSDLRPSGAVYTRLYAAGLGGG